MALPGVMLGELRARAFASVTVALSIGCQAAPLRQPAGVPPTEPSVTREEPGGDASDPHESALRRLLAGTWGWRNDKQDALHVPLPDWQNWRRIRYFGVPSFVGFRYGDDHHVVIAIWVRDADEGVTPEQCLDAFERWAKPTAHEFNVSITSPATTRTRWPDPARLAGGLIVPATADAGEIAGMLDGGALDATSVDGGEPFVPLPSVAPPTPPPVVAPPEPGNTVVVKSVDAELTALFSKKSYAAAYAAYTIWPRTCTIFGVAVAMRGSDDLARQVRDRYVTDGFWRMDRHRQDVPPH
jgi:hypothetical protein